MNNTKGINFLNAITTNFMGMSLNEMVKASMQVSKMTDADISKAINDAVEYQDKGRMSILVTEQVNRMNKAKHI